MATSKLNIQITAVDHASQALKSIQSGIIRLVGAIVALGAAFKAITFPAKAAADFEREMVNVAKTTGFTDSQIEKLSGTMIDLSKNMSVSATELAAIAAIAGQLGLGSFGVEAIEAFTESVAKASVTLGLSVEKAAEFGAQISSIFNLDPSNIENVFSTLNELSNTSVATAGQLADIIKRVGSVGGITLQQSAGLAAFFRDLGVQVEVAGTSTVKVLSNMSAKAKDFAKVAGLSMQQWTELMKKDTVSALTLVTSKLYEMDRAQRDATAKELFGGGRILASFTKVIDDAANGYKRLYTHIDNANVAYKLGTSSLDEYDKVMKSTSEQTKVMFNSAKALAIEMGEHLNPIMLDIVKSMQRFLASDDGRDFFFQMAEGIQSVILGVQNLIEYIAALDINWNNLISTAKALLTVMLGISALKFLGGALAGTVRLVAQIGKLGLGINILLGLMTLVQAKAAVAAGSIAILSASFLPLLAILALVGVALYAFKDVLADTFGFSTTVEVDIQTRINTRNIEKETKDAVNTVADLAQKVADASKEKIVVPLEVATTFEKSEFTKGLVSDFKNAVDLAEASTALKTLLQDRLSKSLQTLDIGASLRVDTSLGDIYGLEDVTPRLQEVNSEIVRLNDEISKSWSLFIPEELQIALDEAEAKLDKLLVKQKEIKGAYKEDLFEGLTGGGSLDLIKETLANIVKLRKDLEGQIDVITIDIETKLDAGATRASLTPLYTDISNLQTELDTLNFDSAKIVPNLVAMELTIKQANAAAKALGPALTEIARKGNAIELNLGTEQSDEVIKLHISILRNKELIKQKEEEISKTAKGTEDHYRKTIALTTMQLKVSKANADLTKATVSNLSGPGQDAIASILKMSLKQAEAYRDQAEQNDLNATNTKSLEQSNLGIVNSLSRQIKARSILQQQIDEFDASTAHAVQTAEQMDGAWDNLGKTIKAMEDSMSAFDEKVDEILRKQELSASQDAFNTGIDSNTLTQLDDINTKYDSYIKRVQSSNRLSTEQGDALIDQINKRRDAEISAVQASALSTKEAYNRKVAEDEIIRTLEAQITAQQNYAKVASSISLKQDAGVFEGADGINEYNIAMLELKDAYEEVASASGTTRKALVSLSKVDGVDTSTLDNYRDKLKEVDKTNITLRSSNIRLQKSLGDATLSLVSTERGKLSKPYDELNTSINSLTATSKTLQQLENSLTTAFNNQKPAIDSSNASLAERNKQVIDLVSNMSKLDAIKIESDDIFLSEQALEGFAKGYQIEVPVVVKDTVDTNEISTTVNKIQEAVPPIEVKVKPVLEKATEADKLIHPISGEVKINKDSLPTDTEVELNGKFDPDQIRAATPQDALDVPATLVVPDAEAKNLLDGKPDTDVNLNVNEVNDGKPLELDANVRVKNAAGGAINTQNNATGGSITGAGSGTSDSILSWLSNGEYVIKASSVAKFGTSFFDMLNSGSMPLPRFATGGGFNLPSSSTMVAGSSDSVDLNFNFNDQSYTLHGERKQAKAIVDLFKNMTRG